MDIRARRTSTRRVRKPMGFAKLPLNRSCPPSPSTPGGHRGASTRFYARYGQLAGHTGHMDKERRRLERHVL
jgi:hypothetical protein